MSSGLQAQGLPVARRHYAGRLSSSCSAIGTSGLGVMADQDQASALHPALEQQQCLRVDDLLV